MRYRYAAVATNGAMQYGAVDTPSLNEAISEIRAQGLLVIRVQEAAGSIGWMKRIANAIGGGRVSLLERSLIARYLALIIRAGITVDRAFEILVEQTERKSTKAVLRQVLESIRKGEALSSALAKHPGVFPHMFTAIVQWGEAGGTLSESLERLASQLERDRELQSKIRGALLYPVIVLIVIGLVGGLMSIFVLPRLVQMFESFKLDLPITTRMFIAVARFLTTQWHIALPTVLLAALAALIIPRLPALRPSFHRGVLSAPIMGSIARAMNLARLNRVLGSLILSGIPIVEALTITERVMGNVRYKEALRHIIAEVQRGEPLGRSIGKFAGVFPPIETRMVSVGEETGRLHDVLIYLAEFYERDVDHMTRNLTQTLEPILLIFVGLIVGGISLAVITPIYQFTGSFGQ